MVKLYQRKRDVLRVGLALWPRILFPAKRQIIKSECGLVTVKDRYDDIVGEHETVEPWVFMRVKNEGKTLRKSLETIEPISKRGVIGYNECTDDSEDIILAWCKEHPGYIPFKYDYEIIPVNSEKYAKLRKGDEKHTLAGYYQAVLDLIPKDEWIIKVDGDHIHYPNIIKHALSLLRNEREWISFSRLNLIRVDGQYKVISYVRPDDHYMIFNRGLNFVNVCGKKKDGSFFAHEALRCFGKGLGALPPPWKPECSNIHLPFEKSYRSAPFNATKLLNLDDFFNYCDVRQFSREFIEAVKRDINLMLNKM